MKITLSPAEIAQACRNYVYLYRGTDRDLYRYGVRIMWRGKKVEVELVAKSDGIPVLTDVVR